MKKIYTLFILIGAAVVLFTTMTATAESIQDDVDDVLHWRHTGSLWGWQAGIADKQDIDITGISHSISNNQVVLTLTVDGTIQSSETIAYWLYFNTTDSMYWMSWSNGEGAGMATMLAGGSGSFDMDPEITASGNTLTGVFDMIGNTTTQDAWAQAYEVTEVGNQFQAEWWGDWAPNSKFTGEVDSGEDTTPDGGGSNTGTPGFELVLVISALVIAILYTQRKKRF